GATLPSAASGLVKGIASGASDVADTAAQYAGRFGESQMGKLHGTSALQFKQLGQEGFGGAMRASYEAGDANLGLGSIGREAAINQRVADLGKGIGDIRNQAEAAGPAMSPGEMADAIQQNSGADFAPGGKNFGEQGAFNKNVENIRQMPEGGITNFAKRATDIKSDAAGRKLIMPVTAETDVANQMSHVNDAEIAKRLPPEITEDYQNLKDQFGYAKQVQPMELRGQAKEALGASPNTLYGQAKQLGHAVIGGPKLGAQAGFGAEAALNTGSEMMGKIAGLSTPASNVTTMGGVTAGLMHTLTTNPQSLGKFANPLMQAAQTGGNQGLAATHFLLANQYPEYHQMMQDQSK